MKVAHDGVFRIDRGWLAARSVDAGEIDPRTLRLFHLGSEQPLQVFGQEDGSFDESDYLLFVGRFRRDKTPEEGGKDFESIYGRENSYWLTWGGEAGRRFQPEVRGIRMPGTRSPSSTGPPPTSRKTCGSRCSRTPRT